MKELITTNFGFAAWVVLKKGGEIKSISSKDGIIIKYPEEYFLADLKNEYKESDFAEYNNLLRKIIREFKGENS